MSQGKHLSLEEARKEGNLEEFAKTHQSMGDEAKFDALLEIMAKPKKGTPDEL